MSNVKTVMGQAASAGVFRDGAWDVSTLDFNPDKLWDINTTLYSGKSKVVSAQDTQPEGLFFKPDGTKMYIIGLTDFVHEYDLGTAWDVSTASYLQEFDVDDQEINPHDIFFKPDGTKMYIVGQTGVDVNEYVLSTPWDVTSASFRDNFSVATEDLTPTGLFFRPDGRKMYITGDTGNDVNEYDLSTAWDVTSASYLQTFSVGAEDSIPQSLSFKSDGTKMYILGDAGRDVGQYNLTTAWDISTASFEYNFGVGGQDINPYGLYFRPDGLGFYVCGGASDGIYQYNLGGLNVIDNSAGPEGIAFKPDGSKFFLINQTGNQGISEYVIGRKEPFSVTNEETTPDGIFFKPDGTKMYVVGIDSDSVHEYNLSTAWDVLSSSYSQSLSLSGDDIANPHGISFKPDGSKMYVVGVSSVTGVTYVFEYDLSTPWNISSSSSATYLQLFSVQTQASGATDLFFKPDGRKMYVITSTGDDVNEYDLSTAWDVTSASFRDSFSVATEDTSPEAIFFKPDGTKMYVIGLAEEEVIEYVLSTAWDVTTAVLTSVFDIGNLNPKGIFFKPDGTQMFILGVQDSVYTYSLRTAWGTTTAARLDDPDLYWDLDYATFVRKYIIADAVETIPLAIHVKPDGTSMYFIGSNADTVDQYNLPVPWSLSATPVFAGAKTRYGTETTPNGLSFKPDGTKMYITGLANDNIDEYDLGTAWAVSTASNDIRTFDLSTNSANPEDVFFRSDGKKMYITGGVGISEYDLSTAWDVTTAVFVQNNTSVGGNDIFFRPDGTTMYTVSGNNRIYKYSLGVQY